jgi:hypothetical protein
MSAAPATANRLLPRLRSVGVVTSAAPSARSNRRAARGVLLWFALAVPVLHALGALAVHAVWPQLRDPEYGRRAHRLAARTAEHPSRPLALVVGSSRTAMGANPAAWEATRPGAPTDPLLFNLGTVGAGPVQQLIALRRALHDGAKPAFVLLEYWSPLLRTDGEYAEWRRVDARRLRESDLPVVRGYFPDPGATEREMARARYDVFRFNHARLLTQAAPNLVPKPGRADVAWADLDRWGWLPGMEPKNDTERRALVEHYRDEYRRRFAGHTIGADATRALRESVAVARDAGAKVAFLVLPESREFRSWYPPEVESAARAHLAALSAECAAPVIDARDWEPDTHLADGFHLSRTGSRAFAAKLGAAIGGAFPSAGQKAGVETPAYAR